MPLGEGDGGELVGLGGKLGPAGLVAGDEVLEDTAVGSERHLDKGLSAESLERDPRGFDGECGLRGLRAGGKGREKSRGWRRGWVEFKGRKLRRRRQCNKKN